MNNIRKKRYDECAVPIGLVSESELAEKPYYLRPRNKRIPVDDFAIIPYDDDHQDDLYHQPNFLWSRNIHSVCFFVFFIIIEKFNCKYDFEDGFTLLPKHAFEATIMFMLLIVQNIKFLHEKYLLDVNDIPEFFIFRDYLYYLIRGHQLYHSRLPILSKKVTLHHDEDPLVSLKYYINMQGLDLPNNIINDTHPNDFIETNDVAEQQHIIDYITFLVNFKFCIMTQCFDVYGTIDSLRIDQSFHYYSYQVDSEFMIDATTVTYHDDNDEVIYRNDLVMKQVRFDEFTLIIIFIFSKLSTFLVPPEQRSDISIYRIIRKVLKIYDSSVTFNFEMVQVILQNIDINMRKQNIEMVKFREALFAYFNFN